VNINPLATIPAYLPLNENLLTCGQPNATQFVALAQAGFEVLVDLGQHRSVERADVVQQNDVRQVEVLGMRYIPIPVQWQAPACGPVHRFFGVMRDYGEKKILVYCDENKRVSVFIFLWRVVVQGWDGPRAWQDVLKIWQPNAAWQAFINQELSDNGIAPVSEPGAVPG